VRRAAASLATVLIATAGACYYGPDPNLTKTGKGKPTITVDFPGVSEPGSMETATFVVTNPGPGDMESVFIAFGRVGDPSLPEPIVESGTGGQTKAVTSVSPEPVAVAPDGVRYRFGPLAEGDSMTIRFELVLPDGTGDVGNAVQVYDGAEPARAGGVRLSTTLQG
jgi:hypothetical protein